ncbi:MAG: DEAD/DEAH box helicase [Rikenellaceae bacterium]
MSKQFQELGLNQNIIKAITELGFQNPTPVQERIIPTLIQENRDIVCLAQTGTGKTAAFGLPILESLNTKDPYTQALILSPTRELCRQITEDINNYGKYYENLNIVAVYGGASIETQIRALKKGAHIIVATPGRMVDLLNRGVANIEDIQTLVLDEADEMLNMGFKDELDLILEKAPKSRRSLLFSATLPLEVEGIAKHYMNKPEIVTVGTRNSGANNVKHYYYVVHAKDRYLALKRIADHNPDIYAIIFCRTRQETQEIADALVKDGYNADALHGELSQGQRDQVMGRFKSRTLSLLVATDVAARGIDVNELTHVINYNLPDEAEQYTHRSGRTGRADKNGISIAIINSKEQHKIKRIEKLIGKTFSQAKIPTGNEVCSMQLLHLIDQIEKVEVKDEIAEYVNLINDKWKDISKEEIVQKVLSLEFNRFLDYYRHAPDLNLREENSRKNNDGTVRDILPPGPSEKGFTWLKINLGYKMNISPRHLIRLLSSLGVGQNGVGKIDVRRELTFAAVTSKAAAYLVEELNDTEYKGFHLKVEIAEDSKEPQRKPRRDSNRDYHREHKKESAREPVKNAGTGRERKSKEKPSRSERRSFSGGRGQGSGRR